MSFMKYELKKLFSKFMFTIKFSNVCCSNSRKSTKYDDLIKGTTNVLAQRLAHPD